MHEASFYDDVCMMCVCRMYVCLMFVCVRHVYMMHVKNSGILLVGGAAAAGADKGILGVGYSSKSYVSSI